MLQLDFKLLWIFFFILLFFVWFLCSFIAIGFEDGVNNSFFLRFCYDLCVIIMFFFDFLCKFLPNYIALVATILIDSFLLSLVVEIAKIFINIRSNL